MKKKALVLAVCMAFATPSISLAKALPSDFVGSSLGEIQSKSFLNEPFKGIIPILFTDIKASKALSVKLAPASIFQKIGAEKLPILNDLQFKVTVKNGKPVINIRSSRPIQMPFLNFVLEIKGPQGSLYQDYTTLLDPKSHSTNTFLANAEAVQPDEILLASSSRPSTNSAAFDEKRTHKVKSGDTLSEIAQALNAAEVSLKKMVSAIHQKNPNAFIGNNIDRLKAGAVLNLPTQNELRRANFKAAAKTALKNKPSKFKEVNATGENNYTVKRGDNLSVLTKKLGHNGISFTKMMKAIHTANPHAFSKNKINLLKMGKVLSIPSLEEMSSNKALTATKKQTISNDNPNLVILGEPKSAVKENAKEFVLDGFIVEKGDTLAKITKQIGHKSVPYSKMMHAIYIANPEAFEKNNITLLIEGAIIRLPSLKEVEALSKPGSNIEKKPIDVAPSKTAPSKEESKTKNKTSNNVALNKLEKRVRELKRDLGAAHSNLSNLELALAGKEVLLKQQSNDLSKLASTLELLNTGESPSDITQTTKNLAEEEEKDDKAQATLNPEISAPDTTATNSNPSEEKPSEVTSSPASTEAKSAANGIMAVTDSRSYIPIEPNQQIVSIIKSNLAEYSQYMSGKELISTILALLFGLLLIRYRREIYAYTNISYDYPKYYPPFGEEEARELLKEKPIQFHDTLVELEEAQTPSPTSDDSNTEFSKEQLQECEELAEELIEDLNITTSVHSDNEDWDELDKACDDYIAEHKGKNTVELTDTDDNIIEGTSAESDEMSFEMFEALAEGIVESKSAQTFDDIEDDTMIYSFDKEQAESQHDTFEDKQPIPFNELAELSEKLDQDKAQHS